MKRARDAARGETREETIAALVQSLTPVNGPGRTAHLVALWLCLSWLYTVAIVSATGPWRAGFTEQLLTSPQFLMESLLGLVAGAALIVAAMRLAIPNPARVLIRCAPALLLLALWASSYVVGLWVPALDPSMLGKREFCRWETLLYSGPPLIAGLFLLKRLAPLHPRASGALLGLAAAALPALAMQFACMYTPEHSLDHHLAPIPIAAVIGALIAPRLLRAPISQPVRSAPG